MKHGAAIAALAALALAIGACAPQPVTPSIAPRRVGEKVWHGQGYKQVEEEITVVHLKGNEAERTEQQAALLSSEISAFNDIIRRNRVLQEITRGGCTNFAAFGRATADGKVRHGRTFDFYGLGAMDRYKVVYIVEPSGGIPYVSIGWPGWGGHASVHTAMNAAGVSLGYMWANSLEERIGSTPLLWGLFRQVIESARTLDEAVEIIGRSRRSSAANLLLTDAKIPDAAVVEMTSREVSVRRATADAVYATNHFISPRMRQPIKDPNSVARYERLGQLLRVHAGRIDTRTAVAFLRDHFDARVRRESLSGDVIAWNIGVLAVVFSPSDLTFWVARGLAPAAYSEFVGFSLKDELAGSQAATRLPAMGADPIVGTPDYRILMTYQTGYIAWLEGNHEQAIEKLSEAVAGDPLSGKYRFSLARAYMDAGKHADALQAFALALATDMNEAMRAYSYFNLGRIHEGMGNFAQMKAAFEQVLRLAIGDPEIEGYARQALEQDR